MEIMVARFRSSGEEGKPHSTKEGRSAEAQRAYIRQHGKPEPRRKTLAVTDRYEKGKKHISKWISSGGKQKKMAKPMPTRANTKINPQWIEEKYKVRVERRHGGGVGIQTHGNKLAKPLNTQTPKFSSYINEDGYYKGGIKIRS